MKERNERIAGWTVTGRGEVPFVIPKKKEEDIKEAWERGRRNWEKVGGGKRKRKRENGSKLHCPQKLEATIAVCLLAPYRLIDTPSNLRNCENNLSTFRRFNHMPRHCNPRLGTSFFLFFFLRLCLLIEHDGCESLNRCLPLNCDESYNCFEIESRSGEAIFLLLKLSSQLFQFKLYIPNYFYLFIPHV